MKSFLIIVLFAVVPGRGLGAEPVRLTADASFKQHLQWSPDGKRFLFTRIHQGKMALWTMPAAGGEAKRLLPNHDQPHFDGHWSADGKRIAYVFDQLQGTDGKLAIHTCTVDGTDDKVLIPHKAFEESPRWKPDGKRLVWVSTRDGNPDLYTAAADGTGIQRLTNEVAFDLHPAWSPDGKKIAFASGRTGKQKIFVMDSNGTGAKKLTEGDFLDSWPAWRPDGKSIAFVSNRTGNYDIWLLQADGTKLVNLTADAGQDTAPAWSPDGKKLAFISTRHGGSDIYTIEVK
jgi:TolB protein